MITIRGIIFTGSIVIGAQFFPASKPVQSSHVDCAQHIQGLVNPTGNVGLHTIAGPRAADIARIQARMRAIELWEKVVELGAQIQKDREQEAELQAMVAQWLDQVDATGIASHSCDVELIDDSGCPSQSDFADDEPLCQ